jgi:hypothetical protein
MKSAGYEKDLIECKFNINHKDNKGITSDLLRMDLRKLC